MARTLAETLRDCQETYLNTIGLSWRTKLQLDLSPQDYSELMPRHVDYCTLLWPRFEIPRIQMAIANKGEYRFKVIEEGIDVYEGLFVDGVPA